MNCPGCGRHEFVIIAHMMISQFTELNHPKGDLRTAIIDKRQSDITTHWCIGCSNCRGQWIVDAEPLEEETLSGDMKYRMRVYRE